MTILVSFYHLVHSTIRILEELCLENGGNSLFLPPPPTKQKRKALKNYV